MAKNNQTVDRIQAVWNKLGGEDGVDRLLRGELTLSKVVRSYREEDGHIFFTVTSDGTTGEGWVKRLEQGGYNVDDYVTQILLSPDFKPTSGITTEIVVMKGLLFSGNDLTTRNIRAEASKRKYVAPNPEVACLIRVMFTDTEIEEMGLKGIITMHKSIKDSDGFPFLLCANCYDEGRWLRVYIGRPNTRLFRNHGSAFAVLAS